MGTTLLRDGQEAQDVNIGKGKCLKENMKVFLDRKNEAVGELNELVEVLAAALVVELHDVIVIDEGCRLVRMLMLVLMFLAMRTQVGGQAKTAQQHMRLGAVMELDVPIGGDPQHQKGNDDGLYLQQSFFHNAKLQKTSSTARIFRKGVTDRFKKKHS